MAISGVSGNVMANAYQALADLMGQGTNVPPDPNRVSPNPEPHPGPDPLQHPEITGLPPA